MNTELTLARKAAMEEIGDHTDSQRSGWCDRCIQRMPCETRMDQESVIDATTYILDFETVAGDVLSGIENGLVSKEAIYRKLRTVMEKHR